MTGHLRLGLFLLTLVAYCAAGDTNNSKLPDENITAGHELRKQLLKNYDKVVVPATNKKLVHMKVNTVFNSVELSYANSHMIIYAWLKMVWNDERLTWNPTDYDKINYITVEHHEIWHPDIMAYNNIDYNTIEDRHPLSIVRSTGEVMWVQPVKFRIHCQADMTYWPYDTQTGVLKIGSWVHSTNVINLTDTAHEVLDIEVVSPHSEWQILQVSSEKMTKIYSCCPSEPYNHVEYNITINRKINHYHSVVFIPALCTVLMNLLVFWLSLDDRCKLIISLFNALIVVVILQVLYSKIPLILSTVPLITTYYTYSLALIVSTAIISVIVKNMVITRKPLSKPISSIVQSRLIEFLTMKESSSNNRTENEGNEIDLQYVEFEKRQAFAKIIDKICFVIFSIIYAILLSRFVF